MPKTQLQEGTLYGNLLADWKRGRVIGYKSGRYANQTRFLDWNS
jgi:hypothetical protein